MEKLNKILIGLIITILSIFTAGCNNNTEPELNEYTFLPTKQEAKEQTEKIVNESLKHTVSTLLGYGNINSKSNLSKSNSDDYYYVDNWHVWRGHITKSPFGIEDAYNAEYLAKVQFRNNEKKVQKKPDKKTKYIYWILKAHAALGFTDSKPYGDEVWYDVEGLAFPLKANPTHITMKGSYDRRWVGIKDGKDSEFFYKAKFNFRNLDFYYSVVQNDYYLNGTIKVELAPFVLKITFNKSRTATTKVYENGKLRNTYTHEYPNFYEIYNIPSLENWELGKDFEFPGPIPL